MSYQNLIMFCVIPSMDSEQTFNYCTAVREWAEAF